MTSERDRIDDGAVEVDESPIDAMLALSPEERLRQNDRMLRTIELVRQGLAAKAGDDGRQSVHCEKHGRGGACDGEALPGRK